MATDTKSGWLAVPVVSLPDLTRVLPLFSSVSAGFPSPADDFLEEELSLDTYLIRNRAATFFLRVSGDSMIGAGIYDGDILIVDRSLDSRLGDIVIALLDGEFTVKRLVQLHGQHYLQAENPVYPPIPVGKDNVFICWGVVTYVIHKP